MRWDVALAWLWVPWLWVIGNVKGIVQLTKKLNHSVPDKIFTTVAFNDFKCQCYNRFSPNIGFLSSFWAHLCYLHGGLICIAFRLSVQFSSSCRFLGRYYNRPAVLLERIRYINCFNSKIRARIYQKKFDFPLERCPKNLPFQTSFNFSGRKA